jgi:6-phosphofructokinase 1
MKRIAVLTSGGDAPGMNPAIRAVVRTGIHYGMTVYGVNRGYTGLIGGDIIEMSARSVGGIIQRGGTILQTARSPEFKTEKGRLEALRNLNRLGIEGLVVIGGDGSLSGALELHKLGFPVVGIPGSIDNDLSGTDMAIGVDTALNTALDALDRIKDTASSHQRAFIIEVMGRNSGYLALMASIAGGAEVVLCPEVPFDLDEVAKELRDAYMRGKAHAIVVVAEGVPGGANGVAEYFQAHHDEIGFEARVTILGHIQRGGSPSAFDRILATRLGVAAVERLHEGVYGVMVGLIGGKIVATPLAEVLAQRKSLDLRTYEVAQMLAR